MKVVDFLGAGLAVLAVEYACLHELVAHSVNGMMFSSSSQLSKQILDLVEDEGLRERLREGARVWAQTETWETQWDRVFESILAKPKRKGKGTLYLVLLLLNLVLLVIMVKFS